MPCQQRSHCLFMSVFCLLFSFHTSLIYPAEPNLKSCQNRPVPSSAFSFQFVVTRFGCVCPISPGDGLCPAGVLQRTVPAAIRPNTHTHTHISLNEPLALLRAGNDSEHLGSGWNQNNLFKSGITKSWVHLDLHKCFWQASKLSQWEEKDTNSQINSRELMMRGECYVLSETQRCVSHSLFSCFHTGDLQLLQHQWWRAAGRGGGTLPQVSDMIQPHPSMLCTEHRFVVNIIRVAKKSVTVNIVHTYKQNNKSIIQLLIKWNY